MQFDFTIPANGAQVLAVVGRFVKYVGGTGKIRVRMDKGGYIDLLPGQGAKGLDFGRLQIEDRSGAQNIGVLLAGNFEFQDDRISGTVDVVDGGRVRTITGQAYIVGGGTGQTASTYAAWQIFNPVGSGKRVAVGAYSLTSGAATGISVQNSAAALATLFNLGPSKLLTAPGAVSNSVAQMRGENRATPNPAAGEVTLDFVNIQASLTFGRTLKEPIVLMPGTGIHMITNAVATSINGTWEWTEEAI